MDELAQMDAELEQLALDQRGNPRATPPLPAEFFIDAVLDDAATKERGRPVYRDQEMIRIRIGPRDLRVRVITDDDRRTYAAQYLAWKKGQDAPGAVEGFPLAQWAMIPGRAVVRNFAQYGIHTVEQLASASDSVVQSIGAFLGLKKHAQDWVESSKRTAPIAKLRDENEELRRRIDTLEGMLREATSSLKAAREGGGVITGPDPQVEALKAQVEALAAFVKQASVPVDAAPVNGTPKRRGRPPGSKNKPKSPVEE